VPTFSDRGCRVVSAADPHGRILGFLDRNNNNNNSVQFFIIYVPSQQPNGQLQTQHNLNAGIYIVEKKKNNSKFHQLS
jgi:hypothetical protein